MCVFEFASCETLVTICARHDGQIRRVDSGPTAGAKEKEY